MNLNLFENREREKESTNFIEKFMEELKKALANFENKNLNREPCCSHDRNQNNLQESKVLEEYNLFGKRKVFLDNKSRYGNDFAWITDENSVCVSEHGDGGSYFISEVNLPDNAKIGEVYEKVNGTYVYNDNITKALNDIT